MLNNVRDVAGTPDCFQTQDSAISFFLPLSHLSVIHRRILGRGGVPPPH